MNQLFSTYYTDKNEFSMQNILCCIVLCFFSGSLFSMSPSTHEIAGDQSSITKVVSSNDDVKDVGIKIKPLKLDPGTIFWILLLSGCTAYQINKMLQSFDSVRQNGLVFTKWSAIGVAFLVGTLGTGVTARLLLKYKSRSEGKDKMLSDDEKEASQKLSLGEVLISCGAGVGCGYGSYQALKQFINAEDRNQNNELFEVLKRTGDTATSIRTLLDQFIERK